MDSFVKCVQRGRQCMLLITTVLLASLATCVSANGASRSPEEFVAKTIAEHERIFKTFDVNTVHHDAVLQDGPGEPSYRATLSYKRLGLEYFLIHSVDNDVDERTVVTNPKYECCLEKKVSDEKWRIADVVPFSPQGEGQASMPPRRKFHEFLYIVDIPLSWLLAQTPLCEITDLQEETHPDGSVGIVLKLHINDVSAVYRDERVRNCETTIGFETVEVKFDLEKYGYVPYEYTTEQRGIKRIVSQENFTQIAGVAVPTRLKSDYVMTDGKTFCWYDATVRYEQAPKYSKSMFFISHYGLPEPEFADSGAPLVRLVLAALGALFALGALWNIYRKRRVSVE